MYQSSSLSRFDHVRRRQLLRMKKRSNWFLAPNQSISLGSESVIGSREASVGKSSFEATSSDALMSSDGGISDTPQEVLRLSSDGSYLDDAHHSDNMHKPLTRLQPPDIVNGNHAASSSSPSNTPPRKHSSPAHVVTEKDVRYFMVENWYGSPAAGGHSWGQAHQGAPKPLLSLPWPVLMLWYELCIKRLSETKNDNTIIIMAGSLLGVGCVHYKAVIHMYHMVVAAWRVYLPQQDNSFNYLFAWNCTFTW